MKEMKKYDILCMISGVTMYVARSAGATLCTFLFRTQVGGLRLEIAADKTSQKVHYFNRKTAEEGINYSIGTFNATAPDKSIFLVPKMCWK